MSLFSLFASVNPFRLPETDPVERFANSGWSKATSPDEIIVAHVLKKLAEDFSGWTGQGTTYLPKLERLSRKGKPRDHTDYAFSLSHGSGLSLAVSYRVHRGMQETSSSWQYPLYKIEFKSVVVNETPLEPSLGLKIAEAYKALKDAHDAAQQAANRAALELTQNEKKWNLAESLLNMKRNEHGALVPVTAEITDDPDEDEGTYSETAPLTVEDIFPVIDGHLVAAPKRRKRKKPNTGKALTAKEIFSVSS